MENKKVVILVILLMCIIVPLVSATNYYNYVYNGTVWVPMLSTSDGQKKVWLEMKNCSYGNVQENLVVGGNITLGQKITFALGEIIDNIVDGWVRITGGLNVTGNITASGGRIYDEKGLVMPSGAVMPFAMSACPDGWIEANGTNISRTEYADLFSAISTMYGNNSGTDFKVPDYRGYFLRGWDNSAGQDPDAATRTDRGDGTTGDNVGTKQEDAFQGHWHKLYTESWNFDATGDLDQSIDLDKSHGTNNEAVADPIADGTHGTPRVSNETRPKNINVLYCVKY